MNGIRFSWIMVGAVLAVLGGLVIINTFHLPFVESVQRGYRGTGMDLIVYDGDRETQALANVVPAPQDPVEPGGTPSREVYQNVQVLGDIDSEEFLRIMAAITEWVSPEQGCTYCHAEGEELSSDSLYTKVVARRMLQMTLNINATWKDHVAATGVTCYTCHRGQPVPQQIWFRGLGPEDTRGHLGNRAGQNIASPVVNYSSLPNDPFTPFLLGNEEIRVHSNTALPTGNRTSIKQTEWTYGLMTHFSQSLGVNCTYCHNTRAFNEWNQSSPAKSTAWYGIRMVRDLNQNYLEPLGPTYPPYRLGQIHADAPKGNCATCHQGAFKPLLGVSMLKDYPALAGPAPQSSASAAP